MSAHLEELRKRLIVILISLCGLTVLSFFFSDLLLTVVAAPIKGSVPSLYFISPYEAFMTKLKISIVGGILLDLPIMFSQLWLFVTPGLYLQERQAIIPIVLISVLLFLVGVCFAYFFVVPFAIRFFLGFQSTVLQPLISVGSYISFFLSLILVFGFMFDVPVLLVGLIWMGVLGTAFLREQRKVVIVLIFVLAAIATPTVDVFTQCLLAVPLWLLYELSILVGRGIERRRKALPRSLR